MSKSYFSMIIEMLSDLDHLIESTYLHIHYITHISYLSGFDWTICDARKAMYSGIQS